MQCGHDCCRQWWALQGQYSWYREHWDSPVACVLTSSGSTLTFPKTSYSPHFTPDQHAIISAQKLYVDKRRHTCSHVASILAISKAAGMTDAQLELIGKEYSSEVDLVISWASNELKKTDDHYSCQGESPCSGSCR